MITTDQILKIAQLYHLSWKKEMEKRGFHHPSKHQGSTEKSCTAWCDEKLVKWEDLTGSEHDAYKLTLLLGKILPPLLGALAS